MLISDRKSVHVLHVFAIERVVQYGTAVKDIDWLQALVRLVGFVDLEV
jgi:hypothetical protein